MDCVFQKSGIAWFRTNLMGRASRPLQGICVTGMGGPDTYQGDYAMTAIIVGIHGLANKPEKDKLKEYWGKSIREGLLKNCKLEKADYQFEMVHWADLLYSRPLHEDPDFDFDSLYNTQPYREAADGALKEYKDSWRDDARAIASAVGGKVADMLDEHFGMDGLGKFLIRNKLRDLDFYYDEDRQIANRSGKKQQARRVLKDELKNTLLNIDRGDGPLIVIGHSMGSIIAYDVLREIGRKNPEFTVDHFVTIGSPLGLPLVKLNVDRHNRGRADEDRVRTPTVVRGSWINYADRKDPVSFDNHLRDDYGKNRHGIRVEDDIVLNDYVDDKGKRNPHKSYGYLRTPELSKFLNQFVGVSSRVPA